MHRTQTALISASFPRHIQALVVVYFVASLAHFTHNAEFIEFYPNLPRWITRETVYLAWLTITGVGVAGLIALRLRLPALGAMLIGLYGAFGLDGLAHYTLALCSEHTFATNATIWFEVVTGMALLLTSMAWAGRRIVR